MSCFCYNRKGKHLVHGLYIYSLIFLSDIVKTGKHKFSQINSYRFDAAF